MIDSKNTSKFNKNQVIKAIETVYNGYKFRSRLEARWAVFFDALGVKYEYEAEGYDLGHLGYYLPDFEITLPDGLSLFCEIKPDNFIEFGSKDSREITKYKHLVNETKKPLLVVTGTPDYRAYFLLTPGEDENSGGQPVCFLRHGKYFENVFCQEIFPFVEIRQSKNMVRFYFDVERKNSMSLFGLELVYAISRAKRARFEHGETPSTKPIKPKWA